MPLYMLYTNNFQQDHANDYLTIEGFADIILANITAGQKSMLCRKWASHTKPATWYISQFKIYSYINSITFRSIKTFCEEEHDSNKLLASNAD